MLVIRRGSLPLAHRWRTAVPCLRSAPSAAPARLRAIDATARWRGHTLAASPGHLPPAGARHSRGGFGRGRRRDCGVDELRLSARRAGCSDRQSIFSFSSEAGPRRQLAFSFPELALVLLQWRSVVRAPACGWRLALVPLTSFRPEEHCQRFIQRTRCSGKARTYCRL